MVTASTEEKGLRCSLQDSNVFFASMYINMESSPDEIRFSMVPIVDVIELLQNPFSNFSKEVIVRCQYTTTVLSDDFPQSIKS